MKRKLLTPDGEQPIASESSWCYDAISPHGAAVTVRVRGKLQLAPFPQSYWYWDGTSISRGPGAVKRKFRSSLRLLGTGEGGRLAYSASPAQRKPL